MTDSILVIEDNSDVRENITELLELAGYTVHAAVNGKEGVKMAINLLPDLILCDIMMPKMDGYGVLYMLGKNTKTTHIPFVFLTAKAEKQDFREGMNKGADDYVTKPFTEIELLQAVETRLRRYKQISEGATATEQLNTIIEIEQQYTGIADLIDTKRYESFKKKDTIFREGNNSHFVYLIETGKVKTVKSSEFGKELTLELYGEQDFFGYISIIENQPYTHTAVAIEDTKCLVIPKDKFLSLLTSHKDVSTQVIRMLSKKVGVEEDALLNFAYNSVRKRVAIGLLKLAGKYEGAQNGNPFPVPREDLANLVGTSTESVIRVLAEMKEDQLIGIEGRKIRLLDLNRMEKLNY